MKLVNTINTDLSVSAVPEAAVTFMGEGRAD
jgi:hypothetical protein